MVKKKKIRKKKAVKSSPANFEEKMKAIEEKANKLLEDKLMKIDTSKAGRKRKLKRKKKVVKKFD